jgi:hypothetical protein
VADLGAVQSQDYPAAKWALGMRVRNASDASIERAFADGAILRTHVLRPTWHFVAPADIRWMLRLTAPRVKAAMAFYDRAVGLAESDFERSNAAIARALEGGKLLIRPEIGDALREFGVSVPDNATLGHMLIHAELDGVICSGPRRGKQFTYALLEERVASARSLDRDEALAELTHRYFTSHGPATERDFAWWSGLTLSDTRRGIALNGSALAELTVEGKHYWLGCERMSAPTSPDRDALYLLPNYDEYTVAYRERDLFYDRRRAKTWNGRASVPFGNVMVRAGRVVGGWTRSTDGRGRLTVSSAWFADASEAAKTELPAAVERYAAFLGLEARAPDRQLVTI